MKRMISIWLLVLALICVFTSSLLSEEKPYVPPPTNGNGGDDDGDGHPWGGDDNSSGVPGGRRGVYIQPITITGLPGIDFVFFILKQEWILTSRDNLTTTSVTSGNNHTVYRSQRHRPIVSTIPDRRQTSRNERVQPR